MERSTKQARRNVGMIAFERNCEAVRVSGKPGKPVKAYRVPGRPEHAEYHRLAGEVEREARRLERFGGALRAWRRGNRMTQKTLAHALDVPQSVLARWETGKHYPSTENINLVEAYCGKL